MEILNEASYKDIHEESNILCMIFNSVMRLENKTSGQYWKAISICVHEKRNSFKEFLERPEWKEIGNWLSLNSFKLNLYDDKAYIIAKFDDLNDKCGKFIDAFDLNCYEDETIEKLCFDYLSAYFDLVIELERRGILRDNLIHSSVFLQMIMTGYFKWGFFDYDTCKYNTKNKFCYFYYFYSPVFLEKLCLFLDFLETNREHIKKQISDEMNIFHDVIREKFIKIFFSDVNIATKRYITTYYSNECPYLTDRDYLSSVEPIRPIRWIDKIRAYIESCLETGKNLRTNENGEYEITIAAIGYVKLDRNLEEGKICSNELKLFGSTLSLLCPKFRFKVEIYVNNKDRYFIQNEEGVMSEDKVNIYLNKVNYSKLFTPNKGNPNDVIISDIIDQHDIVFLLDVPNLYTHEYKLFRRTSKNFPGEYLEYKSEYERLDFKDNDYLVSNYKYAPIHFLISKINFIAMNTNAYEDTLEYNINVPLIEYLEKYIDKNDIFLKDIHIFISSKESINYSKYAELNFTREERYNGKNFHLIMLRNMKKKTIKCIETKKNYIVFSLWNFLKNVDYYVLENEKFCNEIMHSNNEKVCFQTMHIYIKMDWGDSLSSFKFKICYDKELPEDLRNIDQDLLKNLIDKLLKIVFSAENDLFSRCIRHSFSNTIYSQMQYLDDVVFYSLFYREFPKETLPMIELAFEDFDEKPVFSVNQPVFWTVARTIKSLNSKSFLEEQLLEIKREFHKNSKDYSFGEDSTVWYLIKIVREICKKYRFENSYLFRNVCKLLE